MNLPSYPIHEISESILKVFKNANLGLELISCTNRGKTSKVLNAEKWVFVFGTASSPICLEFSVGHPDFYQCNLTFVKDIENHFLLSSYLQMLTDDSHDKLAEEYARNKTSDSKEKFFHGYLKLIEDYLTHDEIRMIIKGEKWINVPFEWS